MQLGQNGNRTLLVFPQPLVNKETTKMQRILSVYDWRKLPFDSQAVILSDLTHQRSVRVRVNAPEPMALYLKQDDIEEEIFLAYVIGLDEIQFEVLGSYSLIARGGDVWFDTLDGSDQSVEPVEPASFTQIVERRVRNPEMELMERKMAENIERRLSDIYASMSTTLAAKEAELVAARTLIASANTTEPASTDGAAASGEPAAEAGAGTDGA